MEHLSCTLIRLYVVLTMPQGRDERGDVPGWVMITVMSVGLVGVIWVAAEDQLSALLSRALGKLDK